jgi:hypothetical protein
MHKTPNTSSVWHKEHNNLRMLKKAIQRGRNERRGEEEVRTALRVTFDLAMNLGERISLFSISNIRDVPLNVESLSDVSTTHGKWRISARRGRAGEKSDCFSILLGAYALAHTRRIAGCGARKRNCCIRG